MYTELRCPFCGSTLGPKCTCHFDNKGNFNIPLIGGGFKTIKSPANEFLDKHNDLLNKKDKFSIDLKKPDPLLKKDTLGKKPWDKPF